MRITRISQQKRKKNYYSVFLDGEYAFSVSEEILTRLKLKEGQEVVPEELSRIVAEEEKHRAMETAWHLLHYRSRSSRELRLRLKQKNCSAAAIDHALERLTELGYMDDARFARDWVRTRREQGKGPELVRAELKAKGIAPAAIADALAAYKESPDEELSRVKALVERKLKQMEGQPPQAVARRIAGFLNRRGFSPETISRVLRSMRSDAEEES